MPAKKKSAAKRAVARQDKPLASLTSEGVSGKAAGNLVIYQTEDGRTRVECRLVDDTIWLPQSLMGELFDRSKKTISEHLQNLFEEGELNPNSVVRNFRTTAADGKSYHVAHYNLEAIETDSEDLKAIEQLERDLRKKGGKA